MNVEMQELKVSKPACTRVTRQGMDAVFRALGSEQRREILRILSESTPDPDKTCCAADEVCACKIAKRLGIVPSTLSHHMSVLAAAGLVKGRRDGQWVYYALCRDTLDAAAQELRNL